MTSALTMSQPSLAQTGGAGQSAWYMYLGDHPITDHWGVHLETQIRREPWVEAPEQSLTRVGVNYKPFHGWTFRPGYTYVRGYSPESTDASKIRHTIFEDIEWSKKPTHVKLGQRLRFEQSFSGDRDQADDVLDWDFRERGRYRLMAEIPAFTPTKGPLPDYYSLYDEVALRFGAHNEGRTFDQNRAYGALGWNLNESFQLELGYLRQSLPVANGVIGTQNNAFQLSINSKLPFRRGLK